MARITVPKFWISQSEALFTVLISYDFLRYQVTNLISYNIMDIL